MKTHYVHSSEEGCEQGAELFAQYHLTAPTRPLGLATGHTMTGLYQALSSKNFTPHCRDVFLLDEYLGLPDGHPNTFGEEIRRQFCEPLGFAGTVHVPGRGDYSGDNGHGLFEGALGRLGPLSVQLLGLGTNGHIAFNEPGSIRESLTREVALSHETREANQGYFDPPELMPARAITQGLATIYCAEALIVLVFGPAKEKPLKDALGPKGHNHPLGMIADHPDITLITDIDLT